MIAMRAVMKEGYAKAYTRVWVVDIIQMGDPLVDGKSAYVHERNPVWADGGVSYSPRELWEGNSSRGVLCARYLQRGDNPIFRMINNHANWQPMYGANSLSKFDNNHWRLDCWVKGLGLARIYAVAAYCDTKKLHTFQGITTIDDKVIWDEDSRLIPCDRVPNAARNAFEDEVFYRIDLVENKNRLPRISGKTNLELDWWEDVGDGEIREDMYEMVGNHSDDMQWNARQHAPSAIEKMREYIKDCEWIGWRYSNTRRLLEEGEDL